jgi:micrococcal nuclease
MIYRLILLLFIVLAGFASTPEVLVADAQRSAILEARVSKVLDGDTFTLKGQSRRIRVWGLDAPEWNHVGGSAATATMKKMISGKTLRCQIVDMDRYRRFVAQCFLPDGRDIAAEMMRAGVATEYCRYSRGYYGTC